MWEEEKIEYKKELTLIIIFSIEKKLINSEDISAYLISKTSM